MFEAFYTSPWQHPILLWTAAIVGLAVAFRCPERPRPTYWIAGGLAALSLLDAWLTTHAVPGLGPLPATIATAVAVFFVIAGDFRYLALREWGTPEGMIRPTWRGGALAL